MAERASLQYRFLISFGNQAGIGRLSQNEIIRGLKMLCDFVTLFRESESDVYICMYNDSIRFDSIRSPVNSLVSISFEFQHISPISWDLGVLHKSIDTSPAAFYLSDRLRRYASIPISQISLICRGNFATASPMINEIVFVDRPNAICNVKLRCGNPSSEATIIEFGITKGECARV